MRWGSGAQLIKYTALAQVALYVCGELILLVSVNDEVGNDPLFGHTPLRLADLAEYPVITYDVGYTGRSHIDTAFSAGSVKLDIMRTPMDCKRQPTTV